MLWRRYSHLLKLSPSYPRFRREIQEKSGGSYPMPRPCSRTGKSRAADDEGPFTVSDLKQRSERGLGIHKTPEVMNVQFAKPRSVGSVYGHCQSGEWAMPWRWVSGRCRGGGLI